MVKDYPFLLGGEWKSSKVTKDIINPYTQKAFAKVHVAQPADIEKAIQLSVKAFEETKKLPSYKRSAICLQISDGLTRRREELGKVLAQETGKPLLYALNEVDRGISTFKIASEEANRIGGEVLPLDITSSAGNRLGITKRFPCGPVAAITPFNFPLNLVCHKLAPALAVGNPIVLKPASATPLSALLLGEIIMKTEWPHGALSILPCSSKDATPLVEDDRFKVITFTGSVHVGWDIKRRAGKKKVILELGGNAAVIVEPDADLDAAAKKCCIGSFAFSGQICISIQRMYVHESVYDLFMKKFIAETKALVVGDPLHEKTTFSSMIDLENAQRIESWVAEAVKAGARVLHGGKRNNAFYEPTILTNVSKTCNLSCQEAFGPIVIVEKYKNYGGALAAVNDSNYGLQCGIYTNNMEKIMRAFRELDIGGIMVNDVPTFRVDNMPYGGVKDSGFGREGVKYAIEEMTELKLLVVTY